MHVTNLQETFVFTQMWRCKASYCSNVAKLSGYVDVQSQSEDDLQDAVSNVGPVW